MDTRLMTAAAVAAGLLSALPASAACSLQAFPMPVTMQGPRPMVAARINGQEGHFVLDSGSTINALNGAFAASLKLKPLGVAETGTHLNVDAHTEIVGVKGADTLNGLVKADTFEFGGRTFKDVGFMASSQVTAVQGLLGQALLKSVDVEYDLAANTVRLAKPAGCGSANLAYWVKDGGAYSMIPLEWIDRDNPHTEAAVYINGVRLRAVFDTGAPSSLITESAAARAGVRTTDAGVVPVGQGRGLDGGFRSWIGAFSSVKIGDEEIQNAPMVIAQSEAAFYDVLLGVDFFLSHHIYVANSQEKIYFTYSGGPVFRVPRPQPVAAAK